MNDSKDDLGAIVKNDTAHRPIILPDEAVATAYMCGVAWQHEIAVEEMSPACQLYNSIEEITKAGCTDECGIVEVEIRLKRWVS
jgi:hypothetical protein